MQVKIVVEKVIGNLLQSFNPGAVQILRQHRSRTIRQNLVVEL
jgi:hypothetical protein